MDEPSLSAASSHKRRRLGVLRRSGQHVLEKQQVLLVRQ